MNVRMLPSEPDPVIYTFGPFSLDTNKRRLFRDGAAIPLAGKVYDTLVVLVGSRGRVVEKDELIQRVWPDTFVSDDSLTQSVSALRKALGDSIDAPQFIVTIPRRGYRFLPDVETVVAFAGTPHSAVAQTADTRDDRAGVEAPQPFVGDDCVPPPEGYRRRVSLRAVVLATVVSLSAAAAAGLWFRPAWFPLGASSSGRSIQSIAVLPLENLSRDPDQEYIADGMTEALIARLGQVRTARVISRTSAMQFKGTRTPIPEVARKLSVDAVVTGSVQRSGERIRVNAQLIRSDPEQQVWSGTYDRDLRDVLALQSELAVVIAQQVDRVVSRPEGTWRAGLEQPVAPEVYDEFLRGTFQLNRLTPASALESIRHFEAALKRDPTFAPAYLGEANAYASMGGIRVGSSPPPDVLPKAAAAAARALELDPTLADAHVVLADIRQQEWRWREADASLRRALALNPSHARAHSSLGWLLLYHGHLEEAIASSRRARALDPLSVDTLVSLAITYFMARRYDEAISELQSVLAIHPDDRSATLILGMALLERKRPQDAIRALELGVSRSDRNPMLLGTLAGAYARAGDRATAQRIVNELHQLRSTQYVTPGAFVFAYTGMGEWAQSLAWLERAFEERTTIMKFIKVNPMYDPVRDDRRFRDLVHRVGLD